MEGNIFMNLSIVVCSTYDLKKSGCICNCTTVSIAPVTIWIMSVFYKLVLNESHTFVTGDLTDTGLRHDLNQWSKYSLLDLLVSFFPRTFTIHIDFFSIFNAKTKIYLFISWNAIPCTFSPELKKIRNFMIPFEIHNVK